MAASGGILRFQVSGISYVEAWGLNEEIVIPLSTYWRL